MSFLAHLDPFCFRFSKCIIHKKKVNLIKRKVYVDDLCLLCKEAKETTMHCLINSSMVALVWYASPLCLRTNFDYCDFFFEWISRWCNIPQLSKFDCGETLSMIAIFAWNIWKMHNKTIFEKTPFNMFNASAVAFRLLNEHRNGRSTFFSPGE